MKKALQKLGLTFALAVIFCVAFVICASAETFKVEYRNDLSGYDTGNLKGATWTDMTNPDGSITLRSDKITAGADHEFFGWFTVEGDVYKPGDTVTFTKDTLLFEAYGERITSDNLSAFINNHTTTGLYYRLDVDINTTSYIWKTFNGIMDLNGHTVTITTNTSSQGWGEANSRYVFVGNGTINHTSSNENGYLFMAKLGSNNDVKDPKFRLWIGKNVTVNTSGALIGGNSNYENLPHISILVYGTVNAKYFAQGFFCDDGENIQVNPGTSTTRNFYAKIEFFETANVTITGDKFIVIQNESNIYTRGPSYEGEVMPGNYHEATTYVTVTVHGGTFNFGEASESTTFWFDEERFSGKWNYNFLAGTFVNKFPGALLDEGYYWSGSAGEWIIKSSECTNAGGHEFGKNEKYYGITPTCLTAGTWLQKCDHCDYVNETYADPLGHDYKLTSSIPATSTSTGVGTWTCQRDNCDGEKTVTRNIYPTLDEMQKVIVTVLVNGKEIQLELTIADIFEYELIDANGDSDHVLKINAIKAYGEYSVEQIVGINLPFGVTFISLPANSTLKYIDLSRTSGIILLDKAFADFKALEKFVFGNDMSVSAYVFQNCSALSEVVISGVSNITFNGASIFSGCTSLTELIIGDNCNSIYVVTRKAFGDASALKVFKVGDNCTDIRFQPEYVFEGSSKMEELHFGKSEIYFAGNSMRTTGGTSPINTLTFSTGEYTLAQNCFNNLSIKELILPDGITLIWADSNGGAFRACKQLEYVYVGRGVKELRSTFDQCDSLRTVVLMEVELISASYGFCVSGGSVHYPLTMYIHSTNLSITQPSLFANRKEDITIYTTSPITNAGIFNNFSGNYTIYYGISHAFEKQNFDATCTEGAYYGYEFNCPVCGKGSIENGTTIQKFVNSLTVYEEIVLEKTYINGPEGFGHDIENGTIISIVYENGFFKKGIKTVKCAICGEDVEFEALAIFVVKGYSVASDGSAIISGYTLNMLTEEKTVLSEYEDLYGTITYGVLFVNVNDNNIENLTFVDGVIQTSKTLKAIQVKVNDEDREYVAFNYRVNKFDPSLPNYADLKIVMAAYVIDENGNISFGQGSSVEEGGNVEYVKSVGVVGTNQTLGAVTLRTLYKKSDFNDQYYGQYFTEASEDND